MQNRFFFSFTVVYFGFSVLIFLIGIRTFFCKYCERFLGAATGGIPWERIFFKISQNSQENTCARACNFIIKETLSET